VSWRLESFDDRYSGDFRNDSDDLNLHSWRGILEALRRLEEELVGGGDDPLVTGFVMLVVIAVADDVRRVEVVGVVGREMRVFHRSRDPTGMTGIVSCDGACRMDVAVGRESEARDYREYSGTRAGRTPHDGPILDTSSMEVKRACPWFRDAAR
jgi:hypothetical protein